MRCNHDFPKDWTQASEISHIHKVLNMTAEIVRQLQEQITVLEYEEPEENRKISRRIDELEKYVEDIKHTAKQVDFMLCKKLDALYDKLSVTTKVSEHVNDAARYMGSDCAEEKQKLKNKPFCECEHEKGDDVQVNFSCTECNGYLGLYQIRKP